MVVTSIINDSSDERSHVTTIAHLNELFSNIVREAAPLQSLQYKIKHRELALRDVGFTVEISSLPWREKERTLNDLAEYTYASHYTMSGLQRYTVNLLMTIDRMLIYIEWTVRELRRLEDTSTLDTNSTISFFWIKNNFIRLALGLPSRTVTAARFAAAQIEKHVEDVEPDRTSLIEDAIYMLEDLDSLGKSMEKLKQVMGTVTKLTDDKHTPPKLHHWFYVTLWTPTRRKSERPGEKKENIPQSLERVISEGKKGVENIMTTLFEIGRENLILQDNLKISRSRLVSNAEDTVELSAEVDMLRKLLEDERRRIAEIGDDV